MSNESEVFARPNDEAVSYQLAQYRLWGSGQGNRSSIVFGERNGAPRLTCFTGQDTPKTIWIGFDPITFDIFLTKLEQIAKSKDQVADMIVNTEQSKEERGKFIPRNTLHMGKSEDGIVYLELEEKGLRLKFDIRAPAWHKLHRISDGQAMSEAEVSALRAISMVNMLRSVMAHWSSRIMPNRPGYTPKKENKPAQPATVKASNDFADDDFQY